MLLKKLKIFFVIIVAFVILFGAVLIVRLVSGPEDTWICFNGQWIKHGNPAEAMPITSCPGVRSEVKPEVQQETEVFTTNKGNTDIIKVKKPLAGELIASPLEIEGEARGTWYFEATFSIKVLDQRGDEIASGIARAQSDWMTTIVPAKQIRVFC